MLSYRHSYHAGNHADVLKHIVLTLCIEALKEKEKGFLYLDTHSGAGRYLLQSEYSEKTLEYKEGIEKIWNQNDAPDILAPYFHLLHEFNPNGELLYYPGSPLIAKSLLREQDRMNLTELHPTDYPLLHEEFKHDNRVKVLKEDGFQQLKSKLPPITKRGVILVDPSYELKEDYYNMGSFIKEGHRRFATGIYLIWYPVVLRSQVDTMIRKIVETGIKRIDQIEFGIEPDNKQKGMTASGMIVINAPWKLTSQMTEILPWIQTKLDPKQNGHYFVKNLVSE